LPCGQRHRALGRQPHSIPGGQHDSAENDLTFREIQPRRAFWAELVWSVRSAPDESSLSSSASRGPKPSASGSTRSSGSNARQRSLCGGVRDGVPARGGRRSSIVATSRLEPTRTPHGFGCFHASLSIRMTDRSVDSTETTHLHGSCTSRWDRSCGSRGIERSAFVRDGPIGRRVARSPVVIPPLASFAIVFIPIDDRPKLAPLASRQRTPPEKERR